MERPIAGPAGLEPDERGDYSVLAPRELLPIRGINTSFRHTPTQVDLRDNADESFRLDVILESP